MTEPKLTINSNGNKFWKNDNGDYHRENDLPACEYADGSKLWFKNGFRHRESGPAYEDADGSKQYWINGVEISEELFNLNFKLKFDLMKNKNKKQKTKI